jgi:hypothetical protein
MIPNKQEEQKQGEEWKTTLKAPPKDNRYKTTVSMFDHQD